MNAFESGRRLCLFFEAGRTRFAIEATSIAEVARTDGNAQRLRGSLELEDLSGLLGGPPEVRPGTALVLDVSPTRVVRIKSIVEVADAASGPAFVLSSSLGQLTGPSVRAAVLFKERVYWELHAEALPPPKATASAGKGAAPEPAAPPSSDPSPSAPLTINGAAIETFILDKPPERALIFESQGLYFGAALDWVSQVIPVNDKLSRMPGPEGFVAGVFPHNQELWTIHALPALFDKTVEPESLTVLCAPLARVGLSAQRAVGVFEGFRAAPVAGRFLTRRLDKPVLFLDLPRMFS